MITNMLDLTQPVHAEWIVRVATKQIEGMNTTENIFSFARDIVRPK